jgi:hypothetical protein
MPTRITYTAIFLIPLLLSGCQTVNNSIDAIGGIFSSKQAKNCTGGDCEAESLLDNRRTNQRWYCYGTTKAANWDCQNEPDQTKIVPITDRGSSPPVETSLWPSAAILQDAAPTIVTETPAASSTADSNETVDDTTIAAPDTLQQAPMPKVMAENED